MLFRSMPGLPDHHKRLEFTQTHVYSVGDAIQLSHPLSPPSPPDLSISHHQGLFQWKLIVLPNCVTVLVIL